MLKFIIRKSLYFMEGLMARIAGINILTNKRVQIALTYIHGIGLSSVRKYVS